LKHRFKKLDKLKKSNVLKIDFVLVFELILSFRQCKDVARKKVYSVVIHLKSIVIVCCRLQMENKKSKNIQCFYFFITFIRPQIKML
jgi:hypothetical protein